MATGIATVDQLTQIISQVIGPSFLLGAVASFIGILFTRMQQVLDRIRAINAIPEGDDRGLLRDDLPRLRRRLSFLHQSIRLAIAAGIATTLLIITAFAMAFLGFQHAVGSALLFTLALILFAASLVMVAREVTISVSEYDHY